MKNKEYKYLENLNAEYLEVTNSKDYLKYIDNKKLIEKIKKFEVFFIIDKIINRFKSKKYKKFLEHKVNYNDKLNYEEPKIAIYTCMTGNYDNIQTPFLQFENVDYIAYVDNNKKYDGWITKNIPQSILEKVDSNVNINRYIKMHPFELFGENYDYSIYVDSNIQIIGDLRELIRNINKTTGLAIHNHRERISIYDEIEYCLTYKRGNANMLRENKKSLHKENFPDNFGVYECNVLVTDLKNKEANEIYLNWWNDFLARGIGRDQISLPYIVWKKNHKFEDIGIIGNNVYLNPKIRVKKHR